jgi:hypothetical protein
MEDKSAGGACIRIKTPIAVGSKLTVQWRFERFSGTAKYCRSEGHEYLVGIQKDRRMPPVSTQFITSSLPKLAADASHPAHVETQPASAQKQNAAAVQSTTPHPEPAPTMKPKALTVDQKILQPDDNAVQRSAEQSLHVRARVTRQRTKQPTLPGTERKPMTRKWLELPWQNRPESLSPSSHRNGESNPPSDGKSEENLMPQATQLKETAPTPSADELPCFHVDLSPVEDIYRTAGIVVPPKGYTILKVVGMLASDHMRGLSEEMKRAAILMALDAAGVPLDQIRQDAKARQSALDSHEAEQRKQVEAEWARKADDVLKIQAELESIKTHYMARISCNLEGVAREKAIFNSWLALKQQASQDMARATELCSKTSPAEPVSAPVAESNPAKASTVKATPPSPASVAPAAAPAAANNLVPTEAPRGQVSRGIH